jgi:hypothetical protein
VLLASAAPTLPLPTCSLPYKCRCRFQKLSDRRNDDGRRLEETLARSVWYSGDERRGKRQRRK